MLSIDLEFHLINSVAKVWEALTNSDTLSQWLFENNFEAIVGEEFEFYQNSKGERIQKSQGEVLEVDEPYKLSYTWEANGQKTTITWTLEEIGSNTTDLYFEQKNFNKELMTDPTHLHEVKESWINFIESLRSIIEE